MMEKLRELRQMRGLTQQELAEKSGVDQPRICEYENGRKVPRIPNAIRLANALNVSIADLIDFPS